MLGSITCEALKKLIDELLGKGSFEISSDKDIKYIDKSMAAPFPVGATVKSLMLSKDVVRDEINKLQKTMDCKLDDLAREITDLKENVDEIKYGLDKTRRKICAFEEGMKNSLPNQPPGISATPVLIKGVIQYHTEGEDKIG